MPTSDSLVFRSDVLIHEIGAFDLGLGEKPSVP
jgi:hypothetical protein